MVKEKFLTQSVELPIVIGSFYIDNQNYLIIQSEGSQENLSKARSAAPLKPCLEIAQFEVNGQRYAIVKSDYNLSICETSGIASLLTSRELQIVELVALGYVNKQIAKKLRISEWTVSTHLRRVFAKLNVDNRAALVYRYATSLNTPDAHYWSLD